MIPRPAAAHPVTVPSAARARPGWARRVATAGVGVLAVVFVLATAGPRVLPYRVSYVRSGSMAPAMPVGALAVFVPTRATDLARGDVIAFVPPRATDAEMVAHRIVDVERTADGRSFVTRGDANARPDRWRIPARGEGWRQTVVVPYLGYGLAAMTVPAVRISLIAGLAVLVAASLLAALWRPTRGASPG